MQERPSSSYRESRRSWHALALMSLGFGLGMAAVSAFHGPPSVEQAARADEPATVEGAAGAIDPFAAGGQDPGGLGGAGAPFPPGFGGGFDGGFDGGLGAGMELDPGVLQTGSLVLVQTASKDRWWAYSIEEGEWDLSPEAAPETLEPPMLSNQLAAYRAGNRVFAVSSSDGEWATLKLEPEVPVQISLHHGHIQVVQGSRWHCFSAKASRWANMDREAR